jgi:cell division ATPase FtsA
MTRRDILMGLASFAASVRAYAKTPEGVGGIMVRMNERHSDICLMRGHVELTREAIPIGRAHFVNDVAWGLRIERQHAAELVRRYGMPAPGARNGTVSPALDCHHHANSDVSCRILHSPPKLFGEIVEARAVELAEFIRVCITAAGAGEVFHAPLLLEGAGISGLAQVIERVAGWEVRERHSRHFLN